MQKPFTASPDVTSTLAGLGRTEGLSWSPDGRRLALAAINRNQIFVADVQSDTDGPIHLDSGVLLSSSDLRRPHGVCWLDHQTLAVANREGSLTLHKIPPAQPHTVQAVTAEPVRVIGPPEVPLVHTPGSLCARPLGGGLVELWVCNSFAHRVTLHLLDARDDHAHLDALMLLQQGLEVPDGVALDPAGAWVAVSNHDRHTVVVHANTPDLHPAHPPAAQLQGLGCPHGVAFWAGGHGLAVSDAGAPKVALYWRGPHGWAGMQQPLTVLEVMDADTFARGHYDPQNGGPKGLDVHPNGSLMALTCNEQPLVFFDLSRHLPVGESLTPPLAQEPAPSDLESLRAHVLRMSCVASSREAALTAALSSEIRLLRQSRSWRLTAPLRAMVDGWLRLRTALRHH